ncbi:MAG: reverse transcriptase/maturase family protein, partial [Patescibacteria group bacterium]
IYDSYSCRKNKGTHRGVKRLYVFVRKVSRNYTRTCFALKMDVKKFFASVDHDILLSLIKKKIGDADLIWLLENILKSFTREKGIPIGNLTSQIFANIYLNELDQFVKHELSVRYYLRYADDFLILDSDREVLGSVQMKIEGFLKDYLKLELHPNKTIIRRYTQGIDFLGYIVLPHYILPRTKTKRRIFQKMREKKLEMKIGVVSKESFHQSLQSYLGFLKHASAHRLTKELKLSL